MVAGNNLGNMSRIPAKVTAPDIRSIWRKPPPMINCEYAGLSDIHTYLIHLLDLGYREESFRSTWLIWS